jgi:hypothetical protein
MAAECITRDMLVEYDGSQHSDGVRFAWENRTTELATRLYPEDERSQYLAKFAMHTILRNTLDNHAFGGIPIIPLSLSEDQVEDWVTGRAVHYVLTDEKQMIQMYKELISG